MKNRGIAAVIVGIIFAATAISILCSPLMNRVPTQDQTVEEQNLPGRVYLEELAGRDVSIALKAIQAKEEAGGSTPRVQTADGMQIETDGNAKTDMESDQGENGDSELSWAKRFEGSVIMGDSIAVGFAEFEFLNETSVVAKTGISLRATAEEVENAAALTPQNVFLYYGFNDIGHVGEDYDRFRSQYEALLDNVLTSMPEATIYVNSLFQPLPDNGTMNGYYNDVSPYNQVILEVCDAYGVTYLDNSQLPEEEDFAADGYHLKSTFYPKWLKAMADAAGL